VVVTWRFFILDCRYCLGVVRCSRHLDCYDSSVSAITTQKPDALARKKGSYGIDAPYLLPIPALLIVFNIAEAILSRTAWPLVPAALIAACMACGLYASLRGKFVVWDELFDQLHLRGDEHILDLGCGRGAVLLIAARHLKTGRSVGVDLWRKGDQSGNAAEATQRNAVAEGVDDRVDLRTADMTVLPFENDSFDLVVSNVAIHNVKGDAARRKAINEVARVLRPGGRLMLADMFATRQYMSELARLGMMSLERRSLGWRLWWSGPWLPTHLVTATKPESRDEQQAS
jgi:arsenite methyltransferase